MRPVLSSYCSFVKVLIIGIYSCKFTSIVMNKEGLDEKMKLDYI
jgi:hypothetical protein